MTDHYDEMSVSPDPSQSDALRQRLHARLASVTWDDRNDRSHPGARHDPPPLRAPMKEIDVTDYPPTNEGRNRRRVVMAAAAAVAVIGVAGIAFAVGMNSGDDESPAPADSPTIAPTTVAPTTAAPTTVAPTTETGVFAGSEGDVPWTVTMPAAWENSSWNSGWGVVKGDPLFGFVTAEVGNIYADPCLWERVEPFGPTVDDLVSAWANVPGFDATATKDVTVDGYAGKQIEFTVPNYNEDQCTGGVYGIWQERGAFAPSPHYIAQGPDQHNRVWILDVDGTRLVILASYFPDTSPQDRAAVDEMLASIQIG